MYIAGNTTVYILIPVSLAAEDPMILNSSERISYDGQDRQEYRSWDQFKA